MWMNNYVFPSQEKLILLHEGLLDGTWVEVLNEVSKIFLIKSGVSCAMVLIYDWIMPALQWKCSPRWLDLVRMLAGERRGVWSSPVSTLSWPRCCQLFLGSQPDNLSLSLSLSLPTMWTQWGSDRPGESSAQLSTRVTAKVKHSSPGSNTNTGLLDRSGWISMVARWWQPGPVLVGSLSHRLRLFNVHLYKSDLAQLVALFKN